MLFVSVNKICNSISLFKQLISASEYALVCILYRVKIWDIAWALIRHARGPCSSQSVAMHSLEGCYASHLCEFRLLAVVLLLHRVALASFIYSKTDGASLIVDCLVLHYRKFIYNFLISIFQLFSRLSLFFYEAFCGV